MTGQFLPPIALAQLPPVGGEPFAGDLFERKKVAEKLTLYLERLRAGCVFAIDAPWGDGKTWFARNWSAHLDQQGYKTIYLDAFVNDFADDPFLMIVAGLKSALALDESQKGKALIDTGARVGRGMLPIAAKVAISAASHLLLGNADVEAVLNNAAKQATGEVADEIETHVRGRIENYRLQQESATRFRQQLEELTSDQAKPLVIFIDELDRCRPTFAVQALERIKHFFEVPGIVFVLAVNREHLENAFRGVYGQSLDATAYLAKFVQFFLRLPKLESVSGGVRDFNVIYCKALAKRHSFPLEQGVENFCDGLSLYATCLRLSLRDLERAFVLFAMAYPSVKNSAAFLAWFVALKVKKPEVFNGIARNERSAHLAAVKILEEITTLDPGIHILSEIADIHNYYASGFKSTPRPQTVEHLRHLGRWGAQLDGFFPWLIKSIDMSVE